MVRKGFIATRGWGFPQRGISSGKEEGPKVENLAAENILDTVLGSAGWEGRPHGRGVGGGTLTAEKQSDRPGEAGGSHRSARTWGPTSKPSSFPHSPGKGELGGAHVNVFRPSRPDCVMRRPCGRPPPDVTTSFTAGQHPQPCYHPAHPPHFRWGSRARSTRYTFSPGWSRVPTSSAGPVLPIS